MITAAVVPARARSVGVPGKNLAHVGGVPLIVRTVRAALRSGRVDRVIVTSDGQDILRLAASEGAEVMERPPHLSTAEATSESAVLHVMDELSVAEGREPEVMAMLQCTSPFTTSFEIDSTIACVTDGGASCAFTATRSHAFIWKTGDVGATGVNHDPSQRLRRQDRPPEFRETGAVYVFESAGFRASGHRFFGRIGFHEVDPAFSLEIDEPQDLKAARALAHLFPPIADLSEVEAVAFDFDGVFTDNLVLTLQDGTEGVIASRSDGEGIAALQRRCADLPLVVLSTEVNATVAARCRKLGLEVQQGLGRGKAKALRAWAGRVEVDLTKTLFVGNDINDAAAMAIVGFAACPVDADPAARELANVPLNKPGGAGAVREICEMLLHAKDGRE